MQSRGLKHFVSYSVNGLSFDLFMQSPRASGPDEGPEILAKESHWSKFHENRKPGILAPILAVRGGVNLFGVAKRPISVISAPEIYPTR